MIRLSAKSQAEHDAFTANVSRLKRLFAGFTDIKAVENSGALLKQMRQQLAELEMSLRGDLKEARKRIAADEAMNAGLTLVGEVVSPEAAPDEPDLKVVPEPAPKRAIGWRNRGRV